MITVIIIRFAYRSLKIFKVEITFHSNIHKSTSRKVALLIQHPFCIFSITVHRYEIVFYTNKAENRRYCPSGEGEKSVVAIDRI